MFRSIVPAGRAYRLVGFTSRQFFIFGLMIASMALVSGARAQQQATKYPDANQDPDQGEPQADPEPPPREVQRARPQKPQPLFPEFQLPWAAKLAELRRSAWEDYGLTFAASYQQLYQSASATAPTARYDTALGTWTAVSTTWTPLDRGGDFEGTLVARGAWREPSGDHAIPAEFGIRDLGAIWSNYEWTSWQQGFKVEDLFWEQKLWGDRFSFRVGNQGPQAVFNFFRFKDARTGFTSSPLAFNEQIPYPTFGLGTSFRWQPIQQDPDLYVVGTLNDMNGDPANKGLNWTTFGLGQYFYGIEIGKNWRRDNGEFDHFHIDWFYADERSTRNPDTTPNKAGGGFKIAGEKQVGNVVGYASYIFNTAQGGGIGATFAQDTAVAGVGYLNPFGVLGAANIGFMWSQIIPDLKPPGINRNNQYGIEAYWFIGVTKNLSVTPGIQLIFDPILNPNTNFVAVPHVKFRVAL